MEWEPVEHFKACSVAAASTLDEVKSREAVPQAIARYLEENKLPMTGACWPELGDLDWDGAGLKMEPRGATGDDNVGVTGSYCGLAETGTLVLLSGENQHATTSLLPETHIAVVSASRIVVSMEDVWDLLRAEVGQLPRQINFVSGPSRTADIEMTLVYGAHGPFRVHIVLVDE
jgi:L-lactate dehydrogenase complex protein LldG